MSSDIVNIPRLLVAGLAAGAWVFVGGILMAGLFGYRDMKTAFDAVGLALPRGVVPFVIHTVVRLAMGFTIVALFALLQRTLPATQALFVAAGFMWLVGVVLPFVVIVQWGLFSWTLAVKMWAWSAGELLLAAVIARWLYHP